MKRFAIAGALIVTLLVAVVAWWAMRWRGNANPTPPPTLAIAPEEPKVFGVLSQLATQNDVEVVVDNGQAKSRLGAIRLDTTHLNEFWPAMEAICRRANLDFEVSKKPNEGRTIRLKLADGPSQTSTWKRYPHAKAGGFMLIATSSERERIIRYGESAPNNCSFNVRLTVLLDPAVEIFRLVEPEVLKAVDDEGHSLVPPRPKTTQFLAFPTSLSGNATLHLANPTSIGTTIERLQGRLVVQMARKICPIVVDDPLDMKQPIIRDLSNCRLVVHPLKLPAKVGTAVAFELPIEIQPLPSDQDGRNVPTSDHLTELKRRMVIEDENGVACVYSTEDLLDARRPQHYTNPSRTIIKFRRAEWNRAVGQHLRLRWMVLDDIVTVAAPFEFRNFPIP